MDIELEENENRKGLTAAERKRTFASAKRIVESAKRAEELIGITPKKSGKRGRPKKSNSKESVAAALGTSVRSVERAGLQVDIAERYTWLQSEAWRQTDVLKFRAHLQRIPVSTRTTRNAGMRRRF
jgi:hypothetical protein